MDETAVYYGDYNRTPVDFRGANSVVIQATEQRKKLAHAIYQFDEGGRKKDSMAADFCLNHYGMKVEPDFLKNNRPEFF